MPAGIRHVAGSEPCTEQEREHHAEPRGLSDWTKPVVGPGSLSRSEDVVRDQEQDVAAKRHLIEPTRIRLQRASKVGRGGSRAPTMSAVVARNILDGVLYVDKL